MNEAKVTEPRKSYLTPLSSIHQRLVLGRRMHVLAQHLHEVIPEHCKVLDVGCGNGAISRMIMDAIPGVDIQGIDVLKRPACAIPMDVYDGDRFPFPDKSFDYVMFVDVLHHTPDPLLLLKEAGRVAQRGIIIKDHLCNSGLGKMILTFMDWIGNRPHGVSLPYNYLSSEEWSRAWKSLGAEPDIYRTKLGLYPWFARPLFEYGLHFVARVPMPKAGG